MVTGHQITADHKFQSFPLRSAIEFLMALFQLNLLAFLVSLLLFLSFCHSKNVTVKVIGQIHCTDCIRHVFRISQTSSGINVFIHCKPRKRETYTQGNGSVDREGKFNVTLSAGIIKDGYMLRSCFARLQTQPPVSPCPVQSAQTASVHILSTIEPNTINQPMTLRFSPITCQSSFFLPHTKFTFSLTLPPHPSPLVDYAPLPSEALLLPPLFPPESSIPPRSPALEPPIPVPAFQIPQNKPNPTLESPSPSPSPIYIVAPPSQTPPPNEPVPPPTFKQLPKPPPRAFHQTPSVPTPNVPPIPPPHHKKIPSEMPLSPKIPILKPPTPFTPNPSPRLSPNPYAHPPLPIIEKPMPPPPNQRKPNPIPRAPPVPQLPPIPPVPRKYFGPPNSKSQPPHST